jgi:hypothetical protein
MSHAFTPWFNVLDVMFLQNVLPCQEVSDVVWWIEKQMVRPKMHLELIDCRSDSFTGWASDFNNQPGCDITRRSWYVDAFKDDALETSIRIGCT